MNTALYFHPEAYTTGGPKLMGRNAAGESFLRGFLAHSRATAFWAQVPQPAHGQAFVQAVRGAGRTEPVRLITRAQWPALAQAGGIYLPGPGLADAAWPRGAAGGAAGHAAWSLCGITHTTSSAGAMDALVSVLTAPVQPWDALICTSQAVRQHVQQLWQAQARHLEQRLGIQRLVLPQTPVIPLGIHTQDFARSPAQVQAARQALGVAPDTLVVLYMGRLSFHAKAHPLAMYQALEQAAQAAGRRVLLLECGWHANDFIARAYAEAAQQACPSVQVRTLDGRDATQRQQAWGAADLFCSLSDNIQETFGITPVEAMAAGLPVVVSDWDGYRDTVQHGVQGFCVPTLMPPPGLGEDLAWRHGAEVDTYDMHCGHACSFVAVDIPATAAAFQRLFQDEALRRQMGAAGQARARQLYDWSVIIPAYEALWAELAAQRQVALQAPQALPPTRWPARLDPWQGFAAYPSATLQPGTLLALPPELPQAGQAVARLQQLRSLAMVSFADAELLPLDEECATLLHALQAGPQPAGQLVQGLEAGRQALGFRGLAWLLKLGVIQRGA